MKKLTVIECPYCYAAWDVRIEDGKEIFRSSLRQYQNPRAVDLYHQSHVYELAGLPVEIKNIRANFALIVKVKNNANKSIKGALTNGLIPLHIAF